MIALAFELKGKTAFFKKPDVNANVYFTYNHVHKVALYGILGAILGLRGYASQNREIQRNGSQQENIYPEFYEKLRDLKVSILPHGDRGYFSKKIQFFNNSVGYASKEQGNNLIVKEQWIENPQWTIYLLDNGGDIFKSLTDNLLNNKCVYLPYLGKNDHPAVIENPRIINLEEIKEPTKIDTLFYSETVSLHNRGVVDGTGPLYYYKEMIPVGMDEKMNAYQFSEITHTNRKVASLTDNPLIYQGEDKMLYFL